MIQRVDSIKDLNSSMLFDLYKEDIEKDRVIYYPNMDPIEGRLCAENDLYLYLRDIFFRQCKGVFYIFSEAGIYISVVRFEMYRDGVLLNSLVTQKEYRTKGYATRLLTQTLSEIDGPVYAHIHSRNSASIALHRKLGFEKFLDYAILLDGSVHADHFTYIYNK